jgi:uncharacterized protein (TIGR02186 family)
MNWSRRDFPILLCAAAVFLVAAPLPAGNVQFPTVRVSPQRVEMSTFYGGVNMRIEGLASPGSKVIVVLRGSDQKETFNRKGRVGPIWINVGKVSISGVPSLLLCYSPEPVEKLLAPGEIERYQLSEAAVKRQMKVSPASLDHEDIRSGYLALKTEQNVYRVVSGAVNMGEPGAAGAPFSLNFHWPRRALPATYEIRVYECRGGAITASTVVPLNVVRAGFPAEMQQLAGDRAALYGILAVLAAILTGFGMDFVVSRLPKKRGVEAEVKPSSHGARGGAH